MDHPRSRGVYDAVTPGIAGVKGSSPLARGLLRSRCSPGPRDGIIPARAGFTGPAGGQRSTTADHPRSRGVYGEGAVRAVAFRGSSPLARGLLTSTAQALIGSGIIPARAGFTDPRPPSRPSAPDHPRSRGVYSSGGTPSDWDSGSSPLARGLPLLQMICVTFAWDHPRSRGVYFGSDAIRAANVGSSPLARGLRKNFLTHFGTWGIIPARAGFTSLHQLLCPQQQDHPRSRGVYASVACASAFAAGSSPLARGLHRRPVHQL